jgi:hypothetical protein
MGKRHFVAVYTDSGCLCGCEHRHRNVTTATACISQPGGYVLAVQGQEFLPLTDVEEAEFQKAMSGRGEQRRPGLDLSLLINGRLKTR